MASNRENQTDRAPVQRQDWSLLRETLAFPLLFLAVLCTFAGVILLLSLLPDSMLTGQRGLKGIDLFFRTNFSALSTWTRALLGLLLLLLGLGAGLRARRFDEA